MRLLVLSEMKTFAFWGASLGIALAVGPIIGGAITNFVGWRWVFLVNVPASAILIIATLKFISESRDPNAKRLDISETITFSAGLALLIWALIDGNDAGWASSVYRHPPRRCIRVPRGLRNR